ncbi:WGxxGxxG family protein [Fischerella sp. JS2]|uniref:WGxxGxxG family protein n=1 Tax=Fischerella sp. JS2 TaxID=2597771 RepID=UPI0028E5E2E1|nr:WGxxGxxG family protein [Fischerella sp. JS2]
MKNNFSKMVSASVLTLGMTILPLTIPAQAQTTTDPTINNPNNPNAPTTGVYYDRGFDWGWLGLLGLLGLAGLAGRKRNDESTRYRDPNAVGSSTYRE